MNGFIVDYTELSFNCDKKAFDAIEKVYAEQKEALADFFDIMLDWSEEDQAGIVSCCDYEVGYDFNAQLMALDKLVKAHGSMLQGYYMGDSDNDKYRTDILHTAEGEFYTSSAGFLWLADYTVAQIEELHKIAQEKFPQQPTDRSDSYEG